jgi:hypothetical protein
MPQLALYITGWFCACKGSLPQQLPCSNSADRMGTLCNDVLCWLSCRLGVHLVK